MVEKTSSHNELLKELWLRSQHISNNPNFNINDAFKALYSLNIGMQECLNFLFEQKPTLDDFMLWTKNFESNHSEVSSDIPDVLSPQDLDFWKKNGYIVLKEAVSEIQCLDAQNAIWEFLNASPDNPSSWYKSHPKKNGLMVVFTQHQALQNIRNSNRIRKAYEQLYETKEIYKTIDKVSFNPPETQQNKFNGSHLHWDVSLALPIPFKLQGLLYLSDVEKDGGSFQCVPGFHNEIENWIKTVPEGENIRDYALKQLKPKEILGKKGDFIIWHQALPHCASPNRGNSPRLVQYLTYFPENLKENPKWI